MRARETLQYYQVFWPIRSVSVEPTIFRKKIQLISFYTFSDFPSAGQAGIVFFISKKEQFRKTKNIFYFILKIVFVLEIFKF